jgi:TolB-like protein
MAWTGLWGQMAGEIFISYRRADMAWAKLLHDQLKAEGVEAWYDAQIGAGQDWRVATANALQASQIFVLLFTANAAMSGDIAKELAAAALENKLIIPVRLENIAPQGAFLYELASRNWINAFEDTEAKLEELARGLAQLVRTGTRDDSVLPFERTNGAKPAPPARKRKTIPALVAGAALVMAAAAVGLFWQHAGLPTAGVRPQPTASRVAVLPFKMLSGNGDARSFADTISEQIVATLNDAQVQAVSGEDAKTLSGTDRDAAAAKLGVEFIVNGSVQSGDQGLHVTVHLDHVSTHATVWTASYDQKGLAAPELQSHIAAKAAGVVGNAIQARRDDPAEMDDAALGLVLKSRATDWTNTPASFLEQRDLVRAIIARAPKYAPAYVGLSTTSSEMMKFASPDEIPQLRADAAKAASQGLALNPTNGEAYRALAMQVPNGRWAEREAMYRRGLAAAPNNGGIQSYLADELSAEGRLREALAFYTRAHALLPTNPPAAANLALAQVETGQIAEGLSLINGAAMIEPSNNVIWQARFYILANFGQVDEARAMLDATQNIPASLEDGTATRRVYLDALKRGTPGAKAAATKAIHSAMAAGDIPVNEGLQMIAKLGDLDGAFTLAGTLLRPNDPRQGLTITRRFLFRSSAAGMRRDPRFMPLAAKIGLVATWEKTGKWPDFCAEPDLPYDCRAAAKAAVHGR